ncbi:MAG TPA: peptidylprolyl isomerase [Candidatus Cybelea sp.]|jgi:foldase protein PrsA|nr:peptidylprolyl isomerase [Candidatus Cybelea sp.]
MSIAQRLAVGLAALLFGTSLTACDNGGTVATVNGQPISQSAFDAKLEATPLARTVLQQMVQDVLIEQYAKSNNIQVTDAEITAREEQLKQNFPSGSWDEMLKSRGLTEDDVHSALREQIVLDKALAKDVTIKPSAIADYFNKNRATFDKPEQVTARHILVPNLAEAQKVEADLKSGKNFGDEAKQYSTDPGSKDKGGELGTFRKGQMVPAFDKVAFTIAPNTISAPVKSPFGYHIIEVEARIPGQKATVASATPQITEILRQQQEAPLIQPFLQGLQQKADIKSSNPNFAGLFPTPPPAGVNAGPSSSVNGAGAASPAGSAAPAAASPAPSST